MPYLLVENGPQTGKRVDLTESKYVFGRHPECDFVIDVLAASRQHFQVHKDGDVFAVEDLKSRNHTYLNEREVQGRQPLKHGDRIRVCDVVFSYHFDDSPAPPQRPAVEVSAPAADDAESAIEPTVLSSMSIMIRPEAKLRAVLEISKSLGRALSLDDVLPKVLDSLFRIFLQADQGFIGLLDEQGNLIPRWTKSRRETDDSVRISRTIVRKVVETKEAILLADAGSHPPFEMSQSIADLRIRSIMCAPLVDSEERVLGLIQIVTLDQRKKFQGDDLEILIATATAAGIAIDNAQLHDRALRQRAVERDLELAREVQRAYLPESRPNLPGYEFYDYYQPANHIGGDYYDYILLPDGRLCVLVADVVGHGVAAAMLMAKLSAEARYSLMSEAEPAAAVNRLNERMTHLHLARFVTMVLIVIHPKSHQVTVVNAGHMAPMHRHADGLLTEPGEDVGGLPLGILPDYSYQQMTFELAPGDSLTMYTDGINEAADRSGTQFTIDRIRQHVRESDGSCSGIGDRIVADVRDFMKTVPQEDDMCLVCVRRAS